MPRAPPTTSQLEIKARESFAAGRYDEALQTSPSCTRRRCTRCTCATSAAATRRCESRRRPSTPSRTTWQRTGKKIAADERAEIEGYIKDMAALRDEQARAAATPPPRGRPWRRCRGPAGAARGRRRGHPPSRPAPTRPPGGAGQPPGGESSSREARWWRNQRHRRTSLPPNLHPGGSGRSSAWPSSAASSAPSRSRAARPNPPARGMHVHEARCTVTSRRPSAPAVGAALLGARVAERLRKEALPRHRDAHAADSTLKTGLDVGRQRREHEPGLSRRGSPTRPSRTALRPLEPDRRRPRGRGGEHRGNGYRAAPRASIASAGVTATAPPITMLEGRAGRRLDAVWRAWAPAGAQGTAGAAGTAGAGTQGMAGARQRGHGRHGTAGMGTARQPWARHSGQRRQRWQDVVRVQKESGRKLVPAPLGTGRRARAHRPGHERHRRHGDHRHVGTRRPGDGQPQSRGRRVTADRPHSIASPPGQPRTSTRSRDDHNAADQPDCRTRPSP